MLFGSKKSAVTAGGGRKRRAAVLAILPLAVLVSVSSAPGDTQQPADVGSAEMLNSIPSIEGFCYGHYGRSASPSLPQCPQRFGQCMTFQEAARTRLNSQWGQLSSRIRRRCVREAQDAFRDDQNDPGVRARVNEGGYSGGFAHDAVERCVARRLHRPAPAAWSSQPAPQICRPGGGAPPPEANLTPAQICNDHFNHGLGMGIEQCIGEESAARARLEPRWRTLSPAAIQTCSEDIRARWEFAPPDQRPRNPWRYTAFEACLAHVGT